MKPALPLTHPQFAYKPAISHSDPAEFRARMERRREQAQREADRLRWRKQAGK